MESRPAQSNRPFNIVDLIKPHAKSLIIGLIAVLGEGAANLLEPWPIKIVLDSVLRSKPVHGWLSRFIQATVGQDKIATLKFAAAAVIAIAVLDAVCSYI